MKALPLVLAAIIVLALAAGYFLYVQKPPVGPSGSVEAKASEAWSKKGIEISSASLTFDSGIGSLSASELASLRAELSAIASQAPADSLVSDEIEVQLSALDVVQKLGKLEADSSAFEERVNAVELCSIQDSEFDSVIAEFDSVNSAVKAHNALVDSFNSKHKISGKDLSNLKAEIPELGSEDISEAKDLKKQICEGEIE